MLLVLSARKVATMAKKSGSSGKRGKKKHEKELKRKNKLANPSFSRLPRKRDWNPVKEGIEGLAHRLRDHYYGVAHDLAAYTTASLATLPSVVWTNARIAALSTDELFARLGAVGIATTEAELLAAVAHESSAVHFAERAWLPLLRKASTVHDRDLARLAACALWKRLRPAEPSIEAILDSYLLGGDHAIIHEIEPALNRYLEFFDRLRPRLTPSIDTLAALDTLLDHGVNSVERWTEMLYELALDLEAQVPDLTRRVAAVFGELAVQLSGETSESRIFLVEDQARLLARIGAKAEGEQALHAMIARLPPDAYVYFTLVDFLTDDASEDPGDLHGAIAALEAAKTILPDPEDHWSFEERITELRDRLRELGEDTDSPHPTR